MPILDYCINVSFNYFELSISLSTNLLLIYMWYIYVLKLEDECYYIGQTHDVDKRFKEHLEGGHEAANFTKIHKPIAIIESLCCNTSDKKEAYKIENEKTIEYAIKYDYDKVKGGKYLIPRKLKSKIEYLARIREQDEKENFTA